MSRVRWEWVGPRRVLFTEHYWALVDNKHYAGTMPYMWWDGRCVGLKRKYNMTKRKDRTPTMIKPEDDLELSIRALEAYSVEPAVINNMLSNLRKIVDKK